MLYSLKDLVALLGAVRPSTKEQNTTRDAIAITIEPLWGNVWQNFLENSKQ